MLIDIRSHINCLKQKVPHKMSLRSKKYCELHKMSVAENIIMLLKSIKSNTFNHFDQVNKKALLVSLFVCQLTIQFSHGSHLQIPISAVLTSQNNLLQQFPQQQQQQKVSSISPLESIYPTNDFYHSKSTFSPDPVNSHNSESSFSTDHIKSDLEIDNSTAKAENLVNELRPANKTELSNEQRFENSLDVTMTREANNRSTTISSDIQIPDFTKHDDLNSLNEDSATTKGHYFAFKSKRQALQSQNGLDWWSKISKLPNNNHSTKTSQTSVIIGEKSNPNQIEHRQEKASSPRKKTQTQTINNNQHHHENQQQPIIKGRSVGSSKKGSTNDSTETKSRNVHKEQSTQQNSILKLKKQLIAIRGKHRQLMTTSVNQLQQLDYKLIESYKLCFKKKMPLYAGMLYRTRDFVVRMAKDVKHENNVLEAMAKQVQSVLHQRMSNKTLVREYNQIMANPNEVNALQQQQTTSLDGAQIQSDQQSIKVVSANKISSRSISTKFKKESPFEPSDMPYHIQDNTLSQTYAVETLQTNTKNRPGSKLRSPVESKSSSLDLLDVKNDASKHDIKNLTTKRPKLSYTVSVNEVNLKKELNKIQALIDRVNGSTSELSAVVDDIVHLFKLTSDKKTYSFSSKTSRTDKIHNQAHQEESNHGPQQNDITANTTSDHQQMASSKKNKKMLKSPIRIFLEKYGKLTMANPEEPNNNSNSSLTMSDGENFTNNLNQPEFKPLFNSTSLSYFESSSSLLDADTGFDYISTENE